MSENFRLTSITAPSLNDSGYASNLNDTFRNINDNFITLANHDFIKGERGESVKLKTIDLSTDSNAKYYIDLLKKSIKDTNTNESMFAPITIIVDGVSKEINWDDNFIESPGMLYLIADDSGNVGSEEIIYTSLYYTFLDARYSAKNMGSLDPSIYSTRSDMSCVAVYQKDLYVNEDETTSPGFAIYNNAFPTIYYESGKGLCWKVNGAETGMPVRGLPGEDGASATLMIVKADQLNYNAETEVLKGVVTQKFDNFRGFVSIESTEAKKLHNSSVLVLAKMPDSNKNGFCFGSLSFEESVDASGNPIYNLYVYTHDDAFIDRSFDINNINNALKAIDANNADISTGLSGLFIPIDNVNSNKDSQAVHLLTAISPDKTVETGSNQQNSELILMPINDINTFQSSANILDVEKYLYLKVKPNAIQCSSAVEDYANKIYKFKLIDIIHAAPNEPYNTTTPYGLKYADYKYSDSDGNVTEIKLSHGNVCVKKINSDVSKPEYSDNVKDSMPSSFSLKLNDGIYCWQIQNDTGIYDDNIDNDNLTAPGPDNTIFNCIYTTDLIPSVNSEFMWFNGVQLADISNPTPFDNKYYIPGWVSNVFEFEKYIPMFVNSNDSVKYDSKLKHALNINYDINITGDKPEDAENSDYLRSVNVNGSVNCENLNVYTLSVSKEIKNIYTKNTIVGESGLKLGYSKDNDESIDNSTTFEVTNNGSIISKGSLNLDGEINAKGSIAASSIHAKGYSPHDEATREEFIKGVVSSNELILNTSSNAELLSITAADDEILANLKDVKSINIEKNDDTAKISSDASIILNKGSNLIVSNENNPYYIEETGKNASNFDELRNNIIYDTIDAAKNETRNYSSNTKSPKSISFNGSDVIYSGSIDDRGDYTYDFKNPNDYSIVKFTLKRSTTDDKFNADKKIKINLASFRFAVSLYTICSYGHWPMIVNDSYMKLKYKIEFDKATGDSNYYTTIEKVINDNYTFSNALSASAIKDGSTHWGTNYNVVGNIVASNDYDAWRAMSYLLTPKPIEINKNYNENIKKCYDNGGTITISIIPEFSMHFKGQTYKNFWGNTVNADVVSDCRIYKFYEVANNMSSSSIMVTSSTYYVPPSNTSNTKSKLIYESYKIAKKEERIGTYVCQDGLVIKHDNTIFGIGYSNRLYNHSMNYTYDKTSAGQPWGPNIKSAKWNPSLKNLILSEKPSLFYIKSDVIEALNNTSNIDKNDYFRYMNSIPLEDIFNAIKHIRQTNDNSWTKFGL